MTQEIIILNSSNIVCSLQKASSQSIYDFAVHDFTSFKQWSKVHTCIVQVYIAICSTTTNKENYDLDKTVYKNIKDFTSSIFFFFFSNFQTVTILEKNTCKNLKNIKNKTLRK